MESTSWFFVLRFILLLLLVWFLWLRVCMKSREQYVDTRFLITKTACVQKKRLCFVKCNQRILRPKHTSHVQNNPFDQLLDHSDVYRCIYDDVAIAFGKSSLYYMYYKNRNCCSLQSFVLTTIITFDKHTSNTHDNSININLWRFSLWQCAQNVSTILWLKSVCDIKKSFNKYSYEV